MRFERLRVCRDAQSMRLANPLEFDEPPARALGISHMRYSLRAFSLSSVLALFIFPTAQARSADEIFPDANLKAAIRDVLKKSESDELKEDDLKNVFILHAGGKQIKSLAGLDKCPNLADITLPRNEIQDLAPLAGLKNVQTIDLANNKITDIAPLAGLDKLQYIQLAGNQVANIGPLKGLVNLSALYLSKNKITAIDSLAPLQKLSSLYLDHNQVVDIKPLAGLKWLSLLDLTGNAVVDISPLAKLTELRYTFLQGNKIADIGPLLEMAKKDAAGDRRFAPYWNLYIGGNPLGDAAAKQIEELKKLGVRVKTEELK